LRPIKRGVLLLEPTQRSSCAKCSRSSAARASTRAAHSCWSCAFAC
jgi:hypothetical protein